MLSVKAKILVATFVCATVLLILGIHFRNSFFNSNNLENGLKTETSVVPEVKYNIDDDLKTKKLILEKSISEKCNPMSVFDIRKITKECEEKVKEE